MTGEQKKWRLVPTHLCEYPERKDKHRGDCAADDVGAEECFKKLAIMLPYLAIALAPRASQGGVAALGAFEKFAVWKKIKV